MGQTLTEHIGFKDFYGRMQELRQERTIDEEDDILMVAGGSEGSGKSTVTLALGGIDPSFYRNYLDYDQQIYFLWEHFLAANDTATKAASQNKVDNFKNLVGGDLFQKCYDMRMKKYNLSLDDLKIEESKAILPAGSFRQYDEAGTQMFNRDAMGKGNKDQVKMFVANRSNRGIYALNVPKLRYCDIYIREERIKILLYVLKEYVEKKPIRTLFVWGKEGILRLRRAFGWQWTNMLEVNFGKAYNMAPPDYRIEPIPNLIGKYIPEEVNALYQMDKTFFQLKLNKEMKEGKEKPEDERENKERITTENIYKIIPSYREIVEKDVDAYTLRTGKGKTCYYDHRNRLLTNGILPSSLGV